MLKNLQNKSFLLIPIWGTLLFVCLYIVATWYYPGGSQIDKQSIGFSWINNYWCNLLMDIAINGEQNKAQPIAIIAMLILCMSLTYFWLAFANLMQTKGIIKIAIQFCGPLSMGIALLLVAKFNHDFIINLASFFGLIATLGTFIWVYKIKWKSLFLFGLLNIFLMVINNYIYYHEDLIKYLPLVQKISFASYLLWTCLIDFRLYKIEMNKQ